MTTESKEKLLATIAGLQAELKEARRQLQEWEKTRDEHSKLFTDNAALRRQVRDLKDYAKSVETAYKMMGSIIDPWEL